LAQTAEILPVEERQDIFLKEFEVIPSPSKALAITGVNKSTLDKWLRTYPTFAARYKEIRQTYLMSMGDRAEERIFEGMLEPKNPWLAVRVAEQFNPDWRKQGDNSYTQINIESAIINPRDQGQNPVKMETRETGQNEVDSGVGTSDSGE